jgi:NADH-quinone oxidoreductase subunit J
MPHLRPDVILAAVTTVLGAVGMFLLLPHSYGSARPRQVQKAGYALIGLSLVLLATFWTPPSDFLAAAFFYAFGFAALLGGVLTVTSRDPVHNALWFASVVLSTSGLFLLSGASFIAAGTIIVYAGAIIVMFLFVIMLAQSEGQAAYDRASRAPGRSTFSCFLLFWGLLYAVLMVQSPAEPIPLSHMTAEEKSNRLAPAFAIAGHEDMPENSNIEAVLDRAVRPATGRIRSDGPHVAGLGATLFSDHLITVEIAGAILFVALVGAAAIATPKPPIRPENRA